MWDQRDLENILLISYDENNIPQAFFIEQAAISFIGVVSSSVCGTENMVLQVSGSNKLN